MAHRHKVQAAIERARGGGCEEEKPDIQEQSKHHVVAEARERKRGGKVDDHDEDDRKRGGRVEERATGGSVGGAKSAARMDRPGRKRGGRVGADTSPLSSANRASGQRLAQQH
jgi:hypothetical protein